jgi:hypothetical protein
MLEWDKLFVATNECEDVCEFKLPIEFADPKLVSSIVQSDLEMTGSSPIYRHLFDQSLLIDKWSSFYTTNVAFLKDTQRVIRRCKLTPYQDHAFHEQYKVFCDEPQFIDRYQYIGFKPILHMNESPAFLHCLGMYNLSTPIFSLLSPLLVLLMPFIILKLRNIEVTIDQYIEHLMTVMKTTSLYKLFSHSETVTMQDKTTAVVSLFIYFLQIYTNITTCITYYKNIGAVYTFIQDCKKHLNATMSTAEALQKRIIKYSTYRPFYQKNEVELEKMRQMVTQLDKIQPTNSIFYKITQLGMLMNLYYEFFMKEEYRNTLLYSFHLNQYIRDLDTLKKKVKARLIHPCKFGKQTVFTEMYYLPLIKEKTVKNTIDLKKNLILSGPNASGKTTVLKSTMINILLSQQIGLGCFSDATVCCYDFFHSYLNIPDTSGRDSLFQAEARRCKDILDCVLLHQEKRHLCIFDEIYSGTNPVDAVSCAKMYLAMLNEHKTSIDYLITTHFIELCKHFVGSDHVVNGKMDVVQTDEKITFLYRVLEGYSTVHGGKYILKEMNYPDILFR